MNAPDKQVSSGLENDGQVAVGAIKNLIFKLFIS